MNNDRKQLIRLAASRPVGDPVRRVLLAELQKAGSDDYPEVFEDWQEADDWVPVHGQDLAYWHSRYGLVVQVFKGGKRYIYSYLNRDKMPKSVRAAWALIKELGRNLESAVKASPDWTLDEIGPA
jgi:hypothetical protein